MPSNITLEPSVGNRRMAWFVPLILTACAGPSTGAPAGPRGQVTPAAATAPSEGAASRADDADAADSGGLDPTIAYVAIGLARRPDRSTPPFDIREPPEGSRTTQSGLRYVVLARPKNDIRPGPNDTVHIRDSAWHPTGVTLYSRFAEGRSHALELSKLEPSWREALIGMGEGETRVYWIPTSRPGPISIQGTASSTGRELMVVYEIELERIDAAPPARDDLIQPPEDATGTTSGLVYRVLQSGTGTETPLEWDGVVLHYEIWNSAGKLLHSTLQPERPRSIDLTRAPVAWREALLAMVVGERRRLWVSEELADGRFPTPKSAHVVDLELLSITKKKPPLPPPSDVRAPPRGALRSPAGVPYRVLRPGQGILHPGPTTRVEVHYTGWTTDGHMFDSSVARGKPAVFSLAHLIPGWTDVVQTMVEGQVIRAWIPEALAYQGKPNRPQGVLVFDIELIRIVQ